MDQMVCDACDMGAALLMHNANMREAKLIAHPQMSSMIRLITPLAVCPDWMTGREIEEFIKTITIAWAPKLRGAAVPPMKLLRSQLVAYLFAYHDSVLAGSADPLGILNMDGHNEEGLPTPQLVQDAMYLRKCALSVVVLCGVEDDLDMRLLFKDAIARHISVPSGSVVDLGEGVRRLVSSVSKVCQKAV